MTTILRIAGIVPLMSDRVDMTAAFDRGSEIHRMTELIDRGEPIAWNVRQRVGAYIDAYSAFLVDVGARLEVLATEASFSDELFGYRGRIDRIVRLDGELMVIDIKTGGINRWVAIQLAGYADAVPRTLMPGDRRPARASLRLMPSGRYQFRRWADEQDFAVWHGARVVANWIQQQGGASSAEGR